VDDRRVAAEPVAFVSHSDHVRLLAVHERSGRSVNELIPQGSWNLGVYDVIGSPGLAFGCVPATVLA
jgi:hypothetical protein